MKTTRIQFNARTFKATRDTMSAYFGAQFELAEALDKARKATKNILGVLADDKADLAKILLGETEGILRTRAEVEKSIEVNTASYNKHMAPYVAMLEKTADAKKNGTALFDSKDSALYKAYCAYATDTTDDKYDAYAKAMADRFVELGLADATADNVAHFMPNADRALRGTTAVKNGDIQGALTAKAFAEAVLRKLYVANKDAFASKKFADYVRKCAEEAKKNA